MVSQIGTQFLARVPTFVHTTLNGLSRFVAPCWYADLVWARIQGMRHGDRGQDSGNRSKICMGVVTLSGPMVLFSRHNLQKKVRIGSWRVGLIDRGKLKCNKCISWGRGLPDFESSPFYFDFKNSTWNRKI